MKKSYFILIGLTLIIIIGSYFYNQYTRFIKFEFPNISFTFNEQIIPLVNVDYNYHLIGMTKEISGKNNETDVPTFEISQIEALNLTAFIEEMPTTLEYVVSYEDSIIYEDEVAPNLTELVFGSNEIQPKEGNYNITLNWDFNTKEGNTFTGSGSAAFNLNVNLPIVAVIDETQVNPGEFIKINSLFGTENEKIDISTNLTSKDITTYEIDGGYEAFIPVDYRLKPGNYVIDVRYYFDDVVSKTETIPVTVFEKEFPTQHLIMPESTVSSTMTAESSAEYNAILYATRALKTPTRYFEESFVAPTEGGIITTDFALTRYTNDNPTPSRHAALDIALPTGTPVYSIASGKAVVARFLQLTGNTIMIDHGYGLISYYYHLDELKIKEGDMVNQSDLIATVGTTGYSTGPHLHFAVSLNETYLNPWFFFPFEGYVMDED